MTGDGAQSRARRMAGVGPTADDIADAAVRLMDVVRRTPLDVSARLSQEVGTTVRLKREDLQVCRSYKVRGAHNLISALGGTERARGVVAASAGNHAQGVAYACRELRIRGTVFLPATTPRQKRRRIADIAGGWVDQVVGGSTYDEAAHAADAFAAETGAVFVHPFDDARTIAGQGTVALEVTAQLATPPSLVIVPLGGGGLLAGTALWLRSRFPETVIVGAEPAGAASMQTALRLGGPTAIPRVDGFVDGAAVGRVGELTFPIVRDLVDDIVTVPEGAVCTEMLDLYQVDGIIAEPAGALASAALLRHLPAETLDRARRAPGDVVCLVSGGNNDVSRYADIVERSAVHEGLRHYFLVTFPQKPGALRAFLEHTLAEAEDIVLFEYTKKNNRETGPALVGVELGNPSDYPFLLQRIEECGMQAEEVAYDSPFFQFLT